MRQGVLLLIVVGVVAGCTLAISQIYQGLQARLASSGIVPGEINRSLTPARRVYLEAYLAAHIDDLRAPAGAGGDAAPLPFTVESGEAASGIAARLATAGLLQDEELFLNYLTLYGLDASLQAGHYELQAEQTIPQMAAILSQGRSHTLEVRFLEGWRLEEMARYLAATGPAEVDADEFLSLARRPLSLDLTPYNYLQSRPPQASLEGYLFPDSYVLSREETAGSLVGRMLANFDRQLDPSLRQAIGLQGMTIHEAVTLASIVEREAVLDEERPLIASVFLNRLQQGMPLQADPTVQYAVADLAGDESLWKNPLTTEDLGADSPFNTYLFAGLPPGPIANPGLSSLRAVAEPAASDYLFFVADCAPGADGQHLFSREYADHEANVARCRQ